MGSAPALPVVLFQEPTGSEGAPFPLSPRWIYLWMFLCKKNLWLWFFFSFALVFKPPTKKHTCRHTDTHTHARSCWKAPHWALIFHSLWVVRVSEVCGNGGVSTKTCSIPSSPTEKLDLFFVFFVSCDLVFAVFPWTFAAALLRNNHHPRCSSSFSENFNGHI